MTTAEATTELHYFLWMIAVVFVASIALGALTRTSRKATVALLQATAFTAVGMLATIRSSDPVDGQTGVAIPLGALLRFNMGGLTCRCEADSQRAD